MMPWQDQYADPAWQRKLAHLDRADEARFQEWAKQNKVPITSDYDMRAFYQALQQGDSRALTAVNPNDKQMHYPDTWKTPLHQSFSGESIYSRSGAPTPRWNDKDQLVAPDGKVLFDERKGTTR